MTVSLGFLLIQKLTDKNLDVRQNWIEYIKSSLNGKL